MRPPRALVVRPVTPSRRHLPAPASQNPAFQTDLLSKQTTRVSITKCSRLDPGRSEITRWLRAWPR
jgi:hypothetical protein